MLVDVADGVATITLNRPHKRNAMSPQLHQDMTDVLEALRYDDDARCLVITGAGDFFCAGMDLKEFFIALKDTPAGIRARVAHGGASGAATRCAAIPKPTIAMINGFCFGGAFSIVEGCDLAIASEDGDVRPVGNQLQAVPRRLRQQELGQPAPPARRALVRHDRPPVRRQDGREDRPDQPGRTRREQLREETMQVARELAAKDPHAMSATKQAYYASLEMSWDAAMAYSFAKEQELSFARATPGRRRASATS